MKLPFHDLPVPVRDELLAALRGERSKTWYVRIYKDLLWHKAVSMIGLGGLLIAGVLAVAGIERGLYVGWAGLMIGISMLGSWLILTGKRLLHLHHHRLVPRSVVATPHIVVYMKSDDDLIELYHVADIRKATVTIYEHRNKKTGHTWREKRLTFIAGSEVVSWSSIEGDLLFDYLQRAAGLEHGSDAPPRGPAASSEKDASAAWPALLAETRPVTPLPRRWPLAMKLGLLVGLFAWFSQMILTERDLWYNVNAYSTTHHCHRYADRAPFGWYKDKAFDERWVSLLFEEAFPARSSGPSGRSSERTIWQARNAIEEYLRLMPNSPLRPDVIALHDDISWAWVESNGRLPRDIARYLEDFPAGHHVTEARSLITTAESVPADNR